ncbi:MAG: peptidase and DD-carboxypeptidase VanY/endolysin [Microbacterium sp.]|jgi:hypothetical protein|nr:peptidase and DD-carboxypeptidase VanY/endolysin [Microbacterium sp.]
MAYANGQFPTGATVALATAPGQRLVSPAAENWDALARAVQARYGWTPYLTDSYRPYAVQERIFRERYRVMWSGSGPYGDVRYWQGVRWVRVTGAAAAVPGTSNHGWGKAVDCSGLGGFGGTRFAQLASLAPSYGFTNTEGRSVGEAWHWVFTGSGLVSNPIGGGGSVTIPNVPGAPAPINPEDFLMALSDDEQRELWLAVRQIRDSIGARGGENLPVDDSLLARVRDLHKQTTGANGFKGSISEKVNGLVAEVPKVPAAAAEKVWGTTVDRGDAGKVNALQELANANNGLALLRGENAGLRTALDALAKGSGLTADEIVSAARTGAAQAVKGGVKVTIDIPKEN